MEELTIKSGSLRDLSEKFQGSQREISFCPLEPNNFISWSKKSHQNSLDLDHVVTSKQKDCMILTEVQASKYFMVKSEIFSLTSCRGILCWTAWKCDHPYTLLSPVLLSFPLSWIGILQTMESSDWRGKKSLHSLPYYLFLNHQHHHTSLSWINIWCDPQMLAHTQFSLLNLHKKQVVCRGTWSCLLTALCQPYTWTLLLVSQLPQCEMS